MNVGRSCMPTKPPNLSSGDLIAEIIPLTGNVPDSINSPLERLGGFVDYFLKPGMQDLPTFIQDTKHVLQIIEELNTQIDKGEVSLDGVGLVALDIESMYSNMSEELGNGASKQFLESRNGRGARDDVTTGSILKALDLCVRNNYFKFNEQVYQQTGGVGTGIKYAPPYACLGVGKYEELLFKSDQQLLELIILWKRYIDDVFMLFGGTEDQCQELVDWLNSLMPGVIKFKFQYSKKKNRIFGFRNKD